ncbi:MAG: 30S ribosomal protein S20 [bacterium]|nr:30S ribosomal protein S20 [bacterium]
MANTKSAKKAVRVIARRTAINKTRRTRMKTFLRRVEEAIAGGNQEEASNALRAAQPEVMRIVRFGILHKNTASRKISRLHARVKALGN